MVLSGLLISISAFSGRGSGVRERIPREDSRASSVFHLTAAGRLNASSPAKTEVIAGELSVTGAALFTEKTVEAVSPFLLDERDVSSAKACIVQ
jgi:hypothetical protein